MNKQHKERKEFLMKEGKLLRAKRVNIIRNTQRIIKEILHFKWDLNKDNFKRANDLSNLFNSGMKVEYETYKINKELEIIEMEDRVIRAEKLATKHGVTLKEIKDSYKKSREDPKRSLGHHE